MTRKEKKDTLIKFRPSEDEMDDKTKEMDFNPNPVDEETKDEQPEESVEEAAKEEAKGEEVATNEAARPAPPEEAPFANFSKAGLADLLINQLRRHAEARNYTADILKAYDAKEVRGTLRATGLIWK